MNLTLLQDSTFAQEPLEVSDVDTYLNVAPNTETANIQVLISAARRAAETENGRELSQKQYLLTLDRFPVGGYYGWTPVQLNERTYNFYLGGDRITLLDPLISIDSFTYTDSTGTVNTLVAGTDFIVDVNKHPGIVKPTYGTQWPSATLWPSSAVQITFTCGFTPVQVQPDIKMGMMLLCSEWYESRLPYSAVRFIAEPPFSIKTLFQNDRLWRF